MQTSLGFGNRASPGITREAQGNGNLTLVLGGPGPLLGPGPGPPGREETEEARLEGPSLGLGSHLCGADAASASTGRREPGAASAKGGKKQPPDSQRFFLGNIEQGGHRHVEMPTAAQSRDFAQTELSCSGSRAG